MNQPFKQKFFGAKRLWNQAVCERSAWNYGVINAGRPCAGVPKNRRQWKRARCALMFRMISRRHWHVSRADMWAAQTYETRWRYLMEDTVGGQALADVEKHRRQWKRAGRALVFRMPSRRQFGRAGHALTFRMISRRQWHVSRATCEPRWHVSRAEFIHWSVLRSRVSPRLRRHTGSADERGQDLFKNRHCRSHGELQPMRGETFKAPAVRGRVTSISTIVTHRHKTTKQVLAVKMATAQMPFSVNQNGAAGGNCSWVDNLQLDWPEAALPRCAGVIGRSVFAAACLAVPRFLATACHFFNDVQLQCTQAVKTWRSSLCRLKKKEHISSTTVSTIFLFPMFDLDVCLSFVQSLLSHLFLSHGQFSFPFKDCVEILPVSQGLHNFWSRSLFRFDTDQKRLGRTASRSMSAQVSLMLVRLATES